LRIDHSRSIEPTTLTYPRSKPSQLVHSVVGICLFGCVLGSSIGGSIQAAHAHGASLELTQGEVDVTATFETGEPMTDAQVLIYTPTDLQTPWATGKTDSKGQFSFTPEADQPGLWEITVRKAGHGHTTTLPVGDTEAGGTLNNLSGSSTAPPAQRWISMAAIVWGFIGTALFFSRKTQAPTEPAVGVHHSAHSAVAPERTASRGR